MGGCRQELAGLRRLRAPCMLPGGGPGRGAAGPYLGRLLGLMVGCAGAWWLAGRRVQPVAAELAAVMRMTRETIAAQIRDPMYAFTNRVRFINYGRCYYFAPFTMREFRGVDPQVSRPPGQSDPDNTHHTASAHSESLAISSRKPWTGQRCYRRNQGCFLPPLVYDKLRSIDALLV